VGALPLDVDVGHEVRTSGRKLTSWFDGGRANDLSGFLFLPIFPRAVHRVHRYHKLAVAIDCLPLAKKTECISFALGLENVCTACQQVSKQEPSVLAEISFHH
jgi:hypothetical protein